MLSETLPFLNPEDNQDAFLRRLGAFHMTIVGQGDTYAEGLFGPLPVYGYPDYLSYVFSFLMADPTIEDERSGGITYSLMVLFFPKDFSIAISSYYSIQEILTIACLSRTCHTNLEKDIPLLYITLKNFQNGELLKSLENINTVKRRREVSGDLILICRLWFLKFILT